MRSIVATMVVRGVKRPDIHYGISDCNAAKTKASAFHRGCTLSPLAWGMSLARRMRAGSACTVASALHLSSSRSLPCGYKTADGRIRKLELNTQAICSDDWVQHLAAIVTDTQNVCFPTQLRCIMPLSTEIDRLCLISFDEESVKFVC